jgi:predicted tellurium resistance membrane protein TerC
MKEKLKEQKLFFISILFMMLFSFPFLKMINSNKFIAGIPQFYFYIFIFWFAAILLIWLIADTHRKKTRQQKDE